MKQIYILLVLCSFAFFTKAQQFTVSTHLSTVQGASNKIELVCSATLVNNAIDSNFTWKKLVPNNPNNWGVRVCDVNVCYDDATVSKSFVLKQGSTGILDVHFDVTTPGITTEAQVVIWHTNNPSSIDTITYQAKSWATGTQELQSSNLNFYPNPVKNVLTVNSTKAGSFKGSIYNILGVELMKVEINGTNTEINVSELPAGSYFLRIADKQKVITKSFVKAD